MMSVLLTASVGLADCWSGSRCLPLTHLEPITFLNTSPVGFVGLADQVAVGQGALQTIYHSLPAQTCALIHAGAIAAFASPHELIQRERPGNVILVVAPGVSRDIGKYFEFSQVGDLRTDIHPAIGQRKVLRGWGVKAGKACGCLVHDLAFPSFREAAVWLLSFLISFQRVVPVLSPPGLVWAVIVDLWVFDRGSLSQRSSLARVWSSQLALWDSTSPVSPHSSLACSSPPSQKFDQMSGQQDAKKISFVLSLTWRSPSAPLFFDLCCLFSLCILRIILAPIQDNHPHFYYTRGHQMIFLYVIYGLIR